MKKNRKAFSLLELIFVIVIMGIVGKFGVELLFQAYNHFLINTAENRFQAQSEATVEQVASRLAYRIPGSEIVRQQSTGLNTFGSIATVADDGIVNTTVFEWVGYDIDGFRGDGNSTRPTWSGFIDLAASQGQANTVLVSPESNMTRVNTTITALSPSGFNGNGLGMFFIQDSNFDVINGFGWNGAAIVDQLSTVHRVNAANNQLTANVGNFGGQKIYEFYKLSWTAYALEHNATTGQLWLHYDYRPWNGQTYLNGSAVLLMENVDTFSLRSIGDAIKVQACIRDRSLFTNNAAKEFSICKEKTVF